MPGPRRKQGRFPSRAEIADFLKRGDGRMGLREISRAFNIAPADRNRLKAALKGLRDDGATDMRANMRPGARPDAKPGRLPPVAVIELVGTNADGDAMARPVRWDSVEPPPAIYLVPERGKPAPGAGDRLLARLRRTDDGSFEARTIRHLQAAPRKIIGVYRRTDGVGRIAPTDRRIKSEIAVQPSDSHDAVSGELVRAEMLSGRHHGLPQARVVARLGMAGAPQAASLIAIESYGIPFEFTAAAIAQADSMPRALGDKRADLRELELVTIDDDDARDFDDAVWAEPDTENPGGWHLIVAIADVAQFVRPGDALDQCAAERGNSVYFPDRTVPMLPEALSNDLCSLRPGEDRACIAAHIWIDAEGRKTRHRFERAVMRSHARLTYAAVQAARDGGENPKIGSGRIAHLYEAYTALSRHRRRRGTLELDLPERRVLFDADGAVADIILRPRYDSHRLIEEFMIAANIAAAETLEANSQPCIYRVHNRPDKTKLASLTAVLRPLGISLGNAGDPTPADFNTLLRRAEGAPHAQLLQELILRSQARAEYSPNNIGHFGLGLRRYCHFTSPIRRYADLLVHRALISTFGHGGKVPGAAGPGGSREIDDLAAIAAAITETERRAAAAERDSLDRYLTQFLADRVGAIFAARVSGVTNFGIFVALDDNGAQGLLPVRYLGDEYFDFDALRHCLVGRNSRRRFSLGDRIDVKLAEADGTTGGLRFDLANGGGRAANRGDKRGGDNRGSTGSRSKPRRGTKRKRTPKPRR